MFGSLREFRKFKQLSQEDFGRKIGLGEKWRNYPNWETGRAPFPPDVQAKIVKLGYDGPFPEVGAEVTREDLQALGRDLVRVMDQSEGRLSKEIQSLGAVLARIQEMLGQLSNSPAD
jgi:hypothetical protein